MTRKYCERARRERDKEFQDFLAASDDDSSEFESSNEDDGNKRKLKSSKTATSSKRRDTRDEAAKEDSKKSPTARNKKSEKTPNKSSKNTTNATSSASANKTTENTRNKKSENTPTKSSKNAPKGSNNKTTEKTPHKSSKNTTDETTENKRNKKSEKTPTKSSNALANKSTSENSSNKRGEESSEEGRNPSPNKRRKIVENPNGSDTVNLRGKVKSITIMNFLTYDYVKLNPSANMNFVIGANGTGKSTILCALCLCLGGKPKDIGRSPQIQQFVKTDSLVGLIKVELYSTEDGKESVTITRSITVLPTRPSASANVFSIDNKVVNERAILNLMSKYNIQMSNLCQYLSQERVQDFSKLTPKDVLLSTQKTIGTADMTAMHTQLIEMSKEVQIIQNELIRTSGSKDIKEKEYETLKPKVAAFGERKKRYERSIICGYKVLLIEFYKHRYMLLKTGLALKKAKIKFDELMKVRKVYLDNENLCKGYIRKSKNEIEALDNKLNATKTSLFHIRKDINYFTKKRKDAKVTLQHIEDFQNNYNIENEKLQKLIVDKKSIEDRERKKEAIAKKIKDTDSLLIPINKKIASHNTSYKSKDKEYLVAIQQKENIKNQMKEDTMDKQWKWHLVRNKATYMQINQWILEEKYRELNLNARVFPSFYTNVNVRQMGEKSVYGRYVTTIIGQRDKIAIFCEHPDDAVTLIKYFRDVLDVSVNIIAAPLLETINPIDLEDDENYRDYGFSMLISQLVECPEPVRRYLQVVYRINKIPVATEGTNVNLNNPYFRFFKGDYLYTMYKSKYTQHKTSRSSPISRNCHLESVAEVEKYNQEKAQLRQSLEKARLSAERCSEELTTLTAQKEKLVVESQKLREKKNKLNEELNLVRQEETEVAKIKTTLASIQKSLKQFKDSKSSIDLEIKAKQEEVGRRTNDFLKRIEEAERINLTSMKKQQLIKLLEVVKLNNLKFLIRYQKLAKHFRKVVIRHKMNYLIYKRNALRILNEFKTKVGRRKRRINLKAYQEKFKTLPQTIELLKKEMANQYALRESIMSGKALFKQFKETKIEFDDLQKKFDALDASFKEKYVKMQEVRDRWLPEISKLVVNISNKFEKLFRYMSCDGNITLSKGAFDDDYENYGYSLKVRFRNGELLRELSGTQSGGERSVATAIYILALQEFTDIPFRCMDEINQGMDAVNERRIMTLMMKISEISKKCQYFVVSPKLLRNLPMATNSNVFLISRCDTTVEKQFRGDMIELFSEITGYLEIDAALRKLKITEDDDSSIEDEEDHLNKVFNTPVQRTAENKENLVSLAKDSLNTYNFNEYNYTDDVYLNETVTDPSDTEDPIPPPEVVNVQE